VRRRLVGGLLGDEREQTALGVQLVQQVRAANVLRGRAAGISRAIDDLVCHVEHASERTLPLIQMLGTVRWPVRSSSAAWMPRPLACWSSSTAWNSMFKLSSRPLARLQNLSNPASKQAISDTHGARRRVVHAVVVVVRAVALAEDLLASRYADS